MHFLECSPSEREVRALPGEVTDNIIDHLHADTETLRATALVCRSWLSSSQFHLFCTTRLQLLTPGKALTDFLAWSSSAQYATAHVGVLIIEGNFTEPNPGDTKRPEICVQDVEIAMGRLPSLGSLIIRGLSLTSGVAVDGLYQPSTRRTLPYLQLSMVATVDATFHPVSHFLSLFSGVEDLVVRDLECVWGPDLATVPSLGLSSPIEHALGVENLTLISTCQDGRWDGHRGIVHLFRHSQPKWQLRSLMTIIPDVGLEEGFDMFLPDCLETLTCLQVWMPIYVVATSDDADPPSTSLLRILSPLRAHMLCSTLPRFYSRYRCPLLETLELWVVTTPSSSDGRDALHDGIVCDRVLAINSEILLGPTLRTVKITFVHLGEYDSATDRLLAGLSNWTKLDDALRRLERAEVICEMTGDLRVADDLPIHRVCQDSQRREADEEVDERIPLLKRMLPMTQASGRLKFQVSALEKLAS